jgi:hypothetical protein
MADLADNIMNEDFHEVRSSSRFRTDESAHSKNEQKSLVFRPPSRFTRDDRLCKHEKGEFSLEVYAAKQLPLSIVTYRLKSSDEEQH